MGISAALPVASVMRCRVKPSPCTATVTPSTGADWRAAKVWMRRVPVFFMEIRSFTGKSMLLPPAYSVRRPGVHGNARSNKKAARRRQGITEIKFSQAPRGKLSPQVTDEGANE